MDEFVRKIEFAKVTHKSFGVGMIVHFDMQTDENRIITVRFENGEKKFSFPSCFQNNYLEFNDVNLKFRFDELFNSQQVISKVDKKETVLETVYSLNLNEDLAINTIFYFYDDKEAFQILVDASSKVLYRYFKNGIITEKHRKLVIFTFSWISFDNYNGNFWEYIRNDFFSLYKLSGNQQALEKAIREVVSEQEKYHDARHITHILVHTGIPKYFLKKFYDFIFDIYKINFDYQLTGQPVEDILLNSLEGLIELFKQGVSADDTLNLNVTQKTYVLIKSTKLAITHYISSLIHIMKQMLEIVDAWYYDVSLENKYPKVLTEKFNEWSIENAKPFSMGLRNQEYVNKPKYVFNTQDKNVRILFPKYVLKGISSSDFDDVNVEMIIDDKREILKKDQFKIIEKIGFNTIEIFPQKLKFISSNISVSINKKEEAIISTNDSLNRKFIIFDVDGQERGNYKEYNDLVYVVYPKETEFNGPNIEIIYDFSGFNIAIFIANKNVIYTCGSESICFSRMLNPGIYGKENINVLAYVENKVIHVFNQVTNFVFESECNSDGLVLKFNNKEYDLISLTFNQSRRGGFWNYNVTLNRDFLSNNLNIIRVYNKIKSILETRTEEFLIDEKLDFLILETDIELEKIIKVTSSFQGANIPEKRYDFSVNTYFLCEFRLGNNRIKYEVDPAIKRYKWNPNDNWETINNLELKNKKTLYLSSIKNIIRVSNKDKIDFPSTIMSDDALGYSSLEMSYLSQLKQENDYVFLNIQDPQGFNSNIKVYLRQVVMSHTLSQQNDDNLLIKFDIKNFTSDSLEVSLIKDKDIIEKLVLSSDETIIKKAQPHTKYTIEVFEKEDFFQGIKGKVIYSFSFNINDATKLKGKSFFVNEVYIYSFDKNNNLNYESIKVKPVVIMIEDKIDSPPNEYSSLNTETNMTYKCRLFKLNFHGQLIPFTHLNEIYIEIVSKKMDSIINFIAEDSEGDGLLLSKKKPKFFVDSMDEDSGYSIDYLVIDTERDEYR